MVKTKNRLRMSSGTSNNISLFQSLEVISVAMYKNVECKFHVANVFDKENNYDLLMTSFFLAYQDLSKCVKFLKEIFDTRKNDSGMFFFKTSVGYLREAFVLLRKSFDNPQIKSKFEKIDKVKEKYNKILSILDGDDEDSFAYKVLFPVRNSVFHYNKKAEEFSTLIDVLKELEKEKSLSRIVFHNPDIEKISADFEFVEEIQMNCIAKFGEKYKNGLNINELIDKLLVLIAEVMNILQLITADYFEKNIENKINYKIQIR